MAFGVGFRAFRVEAHAWSKRCLHELMQYALVNTCIYMCRAGVKCDVEAFVLCWG